MKQQFNENWDGINRKHKIENQNEAAKTPNENPAKLNSQLRKNLRLPSEKEFTVIAKKLAKKKLKRAVTQHALISGGTKAIEAVGKNLALRTSVKLLGKDVSRFLLTKIPFVGLGLGIIFASNRLAKKEYVQAAVELVAGVASTFPGFGTAVAIACDAALLTGDVRKIFAMKTDFQKVRSGKMTEEDFKKKHNLKNLKQMESVQESAETERWKEIDFAVNELISEYAEIDSIIESLEIDDEEETI